MQAIKGKTSHHLWMERRALSSGNVPDEGVAAYIRLQGAMPQDEDPFRISE
jgi:hypothetical protein